jgi:type IV pilus assembly protein PilV
MSLKIMSTRILNVRRNASRADGFTLIEVLVSLVVLSIGLLGTAKLMLFSSRSNDSAYLRSQATELAYEILDNIRANQQQAIAGSYATALATAPTNPGFTCVGGVACTPANLALYDIYQWKMRLNATSGLLPAGALPGGQGSVVTTLTGAQTTVVIKVSWDDSVAQSTFGAAAGTQSITLETLL